MRDSRLDSHLATPKRCEQSRGVAASEAAGDEIAATACPHRDERLR